MKAVIYCRVSTLEQVDNLSLATQEEAARDHCRRNGWAVDHIFVERGESAKTSDRPELQRMLQYLRRAAPNVQFLVVYSLSRFARDNHDHFSLRAKLARFGVKLRSVTEAIDDTVTGKLMEGVLATFAQFDNDVRSERSVAGMRAALDRGRWVFLAPLGYHYVDEAIEPDPETATLVRKAFQLYASGVRSQREVREAMDRRGLRSLQGRRLTSETFNQLLRNPFYAGRLVVPSWGIDRPGAHLPLVSEELFLRVQALLAGKRTAPGVYSRINPDFPLRRFVRCGACQRPLTAAWAKGRSRRYRYYWCATPGCRSVCCRGEMLEGEFVTLLDAVRPEPAYSALFREVLLAIWQKQQGEAQESRTAIERRILAVEQRRQRLIDAYIDERTIDRDSYEARVLKLNKEKQLAEMELRAFQPQAHDVHGLLAFAEHVANRTGDLWRDALPGPKRRLQSAVFPEGVTYLPGIFRTGVTSFPFKNLRPSEEQQSGLVGPSGLEPLTSTMST
jgi:DNA invertase Pin-like site-specific DNA recombinase